DLEHGAVAFAGGEVLAAGPFEELAARFSGAEVTGDDHGVVLPGLVNAHTHLSEALLCGMGEDLTLFEWIEAIVGPAGRHLTREMARVGAMLKGAELLLSGATCVSDMFCHTNMGSLASLGVVDGLEAMGLRGGGGFGPEDTADSDRRPVPVFLAEHEALADRCAASDLVGFRLGVGTVLGQSDELLAASARLARDRGWAVHTHLAEVREEVVQAGLRWGRTTVERAAEVGLLDVPVLAAHCIWVREADIAALARAGATVVHTPVPNMILGSGVCPLAPPWWRRCTGSAPGPRPRPTCWPGRRPRGRGPSGWTGWWGRCSRGGGPTWSGCGATGPPWPTSTTPDSRSSTAPHRRTWPRSGSTGSGGSPAGSWSATTWRGWSRPAGHWPPSWP